MAAIRAAQLGMKTAVIEKDTVGGRCLNYACIPAKAVLRAADVLTEIHEAGEFGITVADRSVDFAAVVERREKVIKTLTGGVAGLFTKNGIDLIEGLGSLTDEGNVRVGGNLTAPRSRPRSRDPRHRLRPKPIPGTHFGGRVIGTEEAWALQGCPEDRCRRRGRLGHGDRLRVRAPRHRRHALRGARPRPADRGRRHLQGRRAGAGEAEHGDPHRHARRERAGREEVTFSFGDQSDEVEWLVIAAGRGPDVEALGLDEAGVKLDEGGLIEVDGALRTSPGVYAIGDLVLGRARAQGLRRGHDRRRGRRRTSAPDQYVYIPRGRSAPRCRPLRADRGAGAGTGSRRGGRQGPVRRRRRATVYGDRTGLVEIVGETKYGELLGGQSSARRRPSRSRSSSSRALEGGYIEVARIIHGHPTLSEAVMEAARAADGWLIHGEGRSFGFGVAIALGVRFLRAGQPRARRGGRVGSGAARRAGAVPRRAEEAAAIREDVERAARALGPSCCAWPEPFPFDCASAMLAATYAKQFGRVVAFSLAAFRQAFAAGRDLTARDNVLIAAAACEIHPAALIKVLEPLDRGAAHASTAEARAGGERPPVCGDRGRRGRSRCRREGQPRLRADRAPPRRGPALLRSSERARPHRVRRDRSGEVVLFWDTTLAQTGLLSRALKAGLAGMEAAEFLAHSLHPGRGRRPRFCTFRRGGLWRSARSSRTTAPPGPRPRPAGRGHRARDPREDDAHPAL